MKNIIGYIAVHKKSRLAFAGHDKGHYGSGYPMLSIPRVGPWSNEDELRLRAQGFIGIEIGPKIYLTDGNPFDDENWEMKPVYLE